MLFLILHPFEMADCSPWWCFVGLNHNPDTYKVSALPIELKHHIPLRAVGCRGIYGKKSMPIAEDWWRLRWDSNSRHSHYKCDALTTWATKPCFRTYLCSLRIGTYPPKIATIFIRLSYMPHHEHIGMEPIAGIEPAHSAWKADVLPLNYIGKRGRPHGKEKKFNAILRR